MNTYSILYTILGFIFIGIIISEIFETITKGKILNNKELDLFFKKNSFTDYDVYSKNISLSFYKKPIKEKQTILSKWYIKGYGRIPRTSKYTEKINFYVYEYLIESTIDILEKIEKNV